MNNMDKIIGAAGQKLGIAPDSLKKALEKGNLDDVLANMNSDDAKKLKTILENKTMLDKLMKSPQAAEMMKQFGQK